MESRAARPPRRDELHAFGLVNSAARSLDARVSGRPRGSGVAHVSPASRRKVHAPLYPQAPPAPLRAFDARFRLRARSPGSTPRAAVSAPDRPDGSDESHRPCIGRPRPRLQQPAPRMPRFGSGPAVRGRPGPRVHPSARPGTSRVDRPVRSGPRVWRLRRHGALQSPHADDGWPGAAWIPSGHGDSALDTRPSASTLCPVLEPSPTLPVRSAAPAATARPPERIPLQERPSPRPGPRSRLPATSMGTGSRISSPAPLHRTSAPRPKRAPLWSTWAAPYRASASNRTSFSRACRPTTARAFPSRATSISTATASAIC